MTHHLDLDVTDLDQPSAELTKWRALAEKDPVIVHEQNAAEVIPFPRPLWSEPKNDVVGSSLLRSFYRSEVVQIPAGFSTGEMEDSATLMPATVDVSLKQFGNGVTVTQLNLRRMDAGRWSTLGLSLTKAEAVAVGRALFAAVALANAE